MDPAGYHFRLSRTFLHDSQFYEVCHRQRLRWDLRPEFGDTDTEAAAAWSAMCDAAAAAATPLIRAALARGGVDVDGEGAAAACTPRVVMSGVVISRPGCGAQRFHSDASEAHFAAASVDPSHRLYTAFVPLVDVDADADGTQFWAGSHAGEGLSAARRGIAGDGTLRAGAGDGNGALEAPGCPRGGLVLFDYRVIHRGLGSVGRERPVAYVVLATGEAWDGANFPQMRLEDASPLYVDHTPVWDEVDDAREALDRESE